MKYKITSLILFTFSFNSFALSIISDLDDTLKITNVLDFDEAARNALFSKKAFAQMPYLIEKMQRYASDLYIVTASPTFLKKPIEAFIEHNNLDVKEMYLRNIFTQRDKKAYKLEVIQSILSENPNENFILIGDDTQYDALVYEKIKSQFPERIEAIYIRGVKNKKYSADTKIFLTPFEIAAREYASGRMSLAQSLSIAKNILFTRNNDLLFPHFTFCPKEKVDFPVLKEKVLTLTYNTVKSKVVRYCQNKTQWRVSE